MWEQRQVSPQYMHWSEGDRKVAKKFCLQEMWKEYWRGSGAGERLCDEMKTVRELAYLGDNVNRGEGCEGAVTARIRWGGKGLVNVASHHMEGGFL